MRAECNAKELRKALALVGRGVEKRPRLSVFASVLVEARDGAVRLSSCNPAYNLSCYLPAVVYERGAVDVPFQQFADLVGGIAGTVVLSSGDAANILRIKAPGVEASLAGLVVEDFPALPSLQEEVAVMDAAALREAIGQVAFAADPDDEHPEYTGVLVRARGGRLTLVALDGYRLACRVIEAEVLAEAEALVPVRAASVLKCVPGRGTARIGFSPGRRHIVFSCGEVELSTTPIEAGFPEYETLVPKNATTRVCFCADVLRRAVKSAGESMVILNIGQEGIQVSPLSQSGTKFRVEAEVAGQPLRIVFTAKYLADALLALGGQVEMDAVSAGSPVALRPAGRDEALHLIMPASPDVNW